MNKDDLADVVVTNLEGTSKAAARRVVDALFDSIGDRLKAGDDVSLHGFGSFKVKQRAARTARNPHTGEPIKVAAKKVVGFKAASALKDTVNKKK